MVEAVKKITVTYFKGRGRAEATRFALGGAVGTDFENNFIQNRQYMVELLESKKMAYD